MTELNLHDRPRADIVSAGRMIEERRALFASPPHSTKVVMTAKERDRHEARSDRVAKAEQGDVSTLHTLAGKAEA